MLLDARHITTIEGAHRIIQADAVDDLSSFVLEEWLDAGFRECVWEYGYEPYQDEKLWREMGSVCPICFALDGQHFKVIWILESMKHNAPKYTLSHVNCKCRFRRIPRQQEALDYSEEMTFSPMEIPEEIRVDPEDPMGMPEIIDIDEIGEENAKKMGIPPNSYWKKWIWDPARNEFIPYTDETGDAGYGNASLSSRWMKRRAGGK